MKKRLLLVIAMVCTFSTVQAEEILTSKSFKLEILDNKVWGDYLDENSYPKSLKVKYIVSNTTNSPVTLKIKLTNISTQQSHTFLFCPGESCYPIRAKDLLLKPWEPKEDDTPTLGEAGSPTSATNPEVTSYIEGLSGGSQTDAASGLDSLLVTYTNVADASDYVSFVAVWNFTTSSIEIIEDISNKIFPNPANQSLNLTFNENIAVTVSDVEIFDVSGEKVLEQKISNSSNSELNIDISSLQNGTYWGNLINAGTKIKKFRFIKK